HRRRPSFPNFERLRKQFPAGRHAKNKSVLMLLDKFLEGLIMQGFTQLIFLAGGKAYASMSQT
ncbi:hypothetical protein, partial [Phyllobacterium sp. YR531]|uniref:hypothetical protein n=1 Tax=Phyllobacterium sp. YR531 TaxID=1144343 RepID=UPI0005931A48